MKKNRKYAVQPFMCCSIIAASLLIAGCRSKGNDNDEEKPAPKALVTVKIDVVKEHDAAITVSAVGKTDALRREKLCSPIAGKIVSLKVYEGSEVKQG